MNRLCVRGWGAVSPAGWGVAPLLDIVHAGKPLPVGSVPGPVGQASRPARTVPLPATRPAWMAHPRLRRVSAITQYAVAAALEALPAGGSSQPFPRLGIVMGTHAACLRYSERFFGEALRDPSTASPMLFPDTVINAPASHLAALLGGVEQSCTVIGDQTVFVQALAIAADWLWEHQVDACLVISAEEASWFAADAMSRFARGVIASEGSGALLLAREPGTEGSVTLACITEPHLYAGASTRSAAASALRKGFPAASPRELLVDSRCGVQRVDRAEAAAWQDWSGPRISPRAVLGEGLSAATAWQCIVACARLAEGQVDAANVSVVGANQQAIGARFARISASPS